MYRVTTTVSYTYVNDESFTNFVIQKITTVLHLFATDEESLEFRLDAHGIQDLVKDQFPVQYKEDNKLWYLPNIANDWTLTNLFSKDLDLHGLGDVVDDEDVTLGSANLYSHPDDN